MAHDLAVVHHIADHVAVMYLGRIVEYGTSDDVFSRPRHPYTQALISAVPIPDPALERTRVRVLLDGDLPSPADDIPGCNFRSRCPLYQLLPQEQRPRCRDEDPGLRTVDSTSVACHYAEHDVLIDTVSKR